MTVQNTPPASHRALERNRRLVLVVTVVAVVALGLVMLWPVDGLDWFGIITVLIGLIGLLVGLTRRA